MKKIYSFEKLEKPMSDQWYFHPKLPVGFYPFFEWPPQPRKCLSFIWNYWLQKSDRTIFLLLAFFTFYFLLPETEVMTTLAPGWIFKVALRDLILFLIVTGGLHWWFYMRKGQGKKFKYDTQPRKKKSKLFSFNNHIYDNMFWSLVSGIPIWVAFEVLLLWSFASGKIEIFQFSDGWIWFCLWFPILQIWQSFHFYWWHRMLHIPFFYKIAHSVHHRNVNPGPWSGYSMHPIEHTLFVSSLLIHFVIPSHPVHVLYHLYWLVLGTVSTHSGYEDIWIRDKSLLTVGSFFHHLHHRYFNCNYGNPEIPLDRWFGSYHDGSEDATNKMRARQSNFQ